MAELAAYPYELKHGDPVRARAVATTLKDGERRSGDCQGEVFLALPPAAVALTASQSPNTATVCWENPFAGTAATNSLTLHWGRSEQVAGSRNPEDYTTKEDVTQRFAPSCLTVAIGGDTTFLAEAATSCPTRQGVIEVKLTDCPECHHFAHSHNTVKVSESLFDTDHDGQN